MISSSRRDARLAMHPTFSSTNSFLLINNPWSNEPGRADLRRNTSHFFASMRALLPLTPYNGPPQAYEQEYPTQQQQHHVPYAPGPLPQQYVPTGPPHASPQQVSYAPPVLSASNYLPHSHRPPFVPPCIPAPPRLSYAPPIPPRLYTQVAPAPSHDGLPLSASQYIPAVTAGPALKVYALSSSGWKDEDKLAFERDNWRAFSVRVENQLGMIPGMARFLDPPEDDPNDCPSAQTHPAHYRTWMDTNQVVCVFLRDVLVVTERTHVAHCPTSMDIWATLRYRHLARSPAGQIPALKRFASISYASDLKTFAVTTTLLAQCNESIWQCSTPDPELFLLSGIISALEANHSNVASTLLAQRDLTLATAIAALDARQNRVVTSESEGAVFAAQSAADSCTNKICPKPSTHTWPYCTSKGGGMAGKTVYEAVNKHRMDNGKPPLPPRQDRPKGTHPSKGIKHNASGRAYITIEGTDHFITPATATPPTPPPTANLADPISSLSTDAMPAYAGAEAWLAQVDPKASVDWNEPLALSTDDTYDIFADTGATVHITLFRQDFSTFTEIPPHAIKGFSGSSINAVGVGTIVNSDFTQEYALYVPNSSICLLSVLRLCQANRFTFHCDDKFAWFTNTPGKVIGRGSVHPHRNLYHLHTRPICLPANADVSPPLYANAATASSRDLRHWHLCLGHAHPQAVADLFTNEHADGMDLDPALDAPICDSCILGKQARTNVPKVHEGRPTTRILERVHVDLSGRIAVKSRSGNEYTFDIVDAHSTCGWAYPVPNK
jgi:hypothetical protein